MGEDNHLSAVADTSLELGSGYHIDPSTGEVFYRKVRGSVDYVAPIDISKIVSKGVYDDVVKSRSGGIKFKLWISPMLLDVVVERQLTIPSISVLCWLGQNIGYNHMVYTTVQDISKGSGYTRQTVSGCIQELKGEGMIRESTNKLEGKGDRFFFVNPLFFFLGYYPNRENVLKDWVMRWEGS